MSTTPKQRTLIASQCIETLGEDLQYAARKLKEAAENDDLKAVASWLVELRDIETKIKEQLDAASS